MPEIHDLDVRLDQRSPSTPRKPRLPSSVSTPSSALLVDIHAYFASLDQYRSGNPNEIVAQMTDGAFLSIDNARGMLKALDKVHAQWRSRVTARADSSVWRLIDLLFRQPAVNSNVVQEQLDISKPVALNSIGLLEQAGCSAEGQGCDSLAGTYLTQASADLDAVASMMPCEVIRDASVDEAIRALSSAEVVLFAGHGISADEPADARLILEDGILTAAQIMSLDLTGLELAVIAACESLATDRRTPEHPFNIQVALHLAGALVSCGPRWAVDDSVASLFTKTSFEGLSTYQTVIEAFRRASAGICESRPDVGDMTLMVRNVEALADAARWKLTY